MNSVVSIRKCDDYVLPNLAEAIERAIGDLGGISEFVRPGDKVLLKPNLLLSADPSKAIVTHPIFVEIVASKFIDAGARVYIGDSPPLGNLARVLAKSGYNAFMTRMGIELVPFKEKISLEFSDGSLFRRIDIAKEVLEFDAVINLPKVKTHTQMVLTLAVKNLFGTVIGSDKASWHLRAGKDFDTFATVLIQIYEKVRPAVSIIDGILGMEGNGPSGGDPRHIGIIGASKDAVALDAVICWLLGLNIEQLKTCVIARELGIGVVDIDKIEVVGDRLDGFPLRDFKRPKSVTMVWNLSSSNPLRRLMERHLVTRPDIDTSICKNCGVCAAHCPPQAITEVDGTMIIDRRKCISCFCCHELCVNKAVRIIQPLVGRFLSRISR